MSNTLLEVKHLVKYYPVGKKMLLGKQQLEGVPVVHAVDDVSFEIHKGEIFGVVGESGCGKSTIGRCVMQLTDITKGQILFDGEDISAAGYKGLDVTRRRMQMVFQNPFSSFNPKHTIGKSLTDPALFHKMTREETQKKLAELMEYISLPSDMLSRHPNELSGGQLQRLAIARALMLSPDFIMADEPVSALDVSVQAQILNLIIDLRDKLGLTMMFISHELTVVEHICDRVMVMYLGAVMEMGTARDIFTNMSHPYSKTLIAAKPKESPELPGNDLVMEGDIPSAIDLPKGCRFSTRCFMCQKGVCEETEPPLTEISPGHWCACHFPLNKPRV